jgi:hypothetical protein
MAKKTLIKEVPAANNTKKYMYYTKGKVNAYVVAKDRKSGKKSKVKGSEFKRPCGKLCYVSKAKVLGVPMKNICP